MYVYIYICIYILHTHTPYICSQCILPAMMRVRVPYISINIKSIEHYRALQYVGLCSASLGRVATQLPESTHLSAWDKGPSPLLADRMKPR